MCIDAHISSSSSQTLVFSVWDVFLGLWVYVFFCQTKVYDVDRVLPFGAWSAHEEVLRLYISIDQASCMNKLHTGYLQSNNTLKIKMDTRVLLNKPDQLNLVEKGVCLSYQLYGYHEYSL